MYPNELKKAYGKLFERFGHQGWWPGKSVFEIILGAILTQNTAWTNVEKALANLRRKKRLSVKGVKEMTEAELAALIRPAGYYNIKAKRIKNFMALLLNDYRGSLLRMAAEDGEKLRTKLLAVSGIGPETADSILLYAFGKPFFVIDAYTKRVFSRHGLRDREDGYHEWQRIFMDALPKDIDLYNDFHAQIVQTAKLYCRSRKLYCGACPLRSYFPNLSLI